jgi:phage gpG-like protein
MKVDVKYKGINKLIIGMKGANKKLTKKRPVFLAAVIIYEQWIKRNFQVDGGLHENKKFKWKPLKETTIAARRGKGPVKILRDTGRLMRDWHRSATDKGFNIRSGVFYSRIHEKGHKKSNIPQRKIFPTDKQGYKIVKPVFDRFMKKVTDFKF